MDQKSTQEVRGIDPVVVQFGSASRPTFELTEKDVREFFGVVHAEIEADGTIYVAEPVAGYTLSREEIMSCLRHLSARRGVSMSHTMPVTRLIARVSS